MSDMRGNSKTFNVLTHLKEHKKITSMEAIKLYYATRLSAIIYNLRHKYHYDISTEMVDSLDRYGHKIRYGVYWLENDSK